MLWGIHPQGKPLVPDVDLDTLARRTPCFTGADLQNLVNDVVADVIDDEVRDLVGVVHCEAYRSCNTTGRRSTNSSFARSSVKREYSIATQIGRRDLLRRWPMNPW